MADKEKIRVERFNGINFGFWKMQIEDCLYKKDLYLSQQKNPQTKKDVRWWVEDPRSKSPKGDPIVLGIDDCFHHLQGKDDQRLDGSTIEDVRGTIGIKQGIIDEKVIQPKDGGQQKRRWAFQ